MPSAILAGSTGLVVRHQPTFNGVVQNPTNSHFQGSHILSTLASHPSFSSIHAFTRRSLPTSSSKLTPIESKDSDTWPSQFPTSLPAPSIFFSGLGTTRAQAGGVAAQRKIDYDLNLSLAKAAKESGVDTYVLVSVAGATSSSMVPYTKMKGQLEEEVQKLGFKNTVIVRPGLIMGSREDSRPAEYAIRLVAKGMGALGGGALTDWWAQDADVIAKAAVNAGLQCVEGKRESGAWFVEQKDIVRLGKKEWVESGKEKEGESK
jgi:HIM1